MNELKVKEEETRIKTLNGYVQQGQTFLFNAAQNLIQYGRVLCEAKPLIAHGEFGKWVSDNFSMSERSAQGYMAVWKRFGENAALNGVQFSSLQKMLSLPEGTEDRFAAENDLAQMTAREVEAAVKRVRAETAQALKAAQAEAQKEKELRAAAEKKAEEARKREPEGDKALAARLAETGATLRTAQRAAAIAQQEAVAAKADLKETEALLEESQAECQRLQAELLDASSREARGDAARTVSGRMTAEDFAGAVRIFLGSTAQVPFMGDFFQCLDGQSYRQWDTMLRTVEDWATRARAALGRKVAVVDER